VIHSKYLLIPPPGAEQLDNTMVGYVNQRLQLGAGSRAVRENPDRLQWQIFGVRHRQKSGIQAK
jgi:hypothetical protein